MALIILCWITLYGTPDNQAALFRLKDKIDITKGQITDAYKTAREEGTLGNGNPSTDNTRRSEAMPDQSPASAITQERTGEHDLNDGKEAQVEQQAAPSAAAILGNIQPKRGGHDLLSSEDLGSILAILKSAQNLLRKTACATPEDSQGDGSFDDKNQKATDANPQATIIKKKSSTGLAESE